MHVSLNLVSFSFQSSIMPDTALETLGTFTRDEDIGTEELAVTISLLETLTDVASHDVSIMVTQESSLYTDLYLQYIAYC